MTWFLKDVTETVTHRRQTTRCDGCGQEKYQGQPVVGDGPCGWHHEEGWLTISLGGDSKNWISGPDGRKHGTAHACSLECAATVTALAFGQPPPREQTGGIAGSITRIFGKTGQGQVR